MIKLLIQIFLFVNFTLLAQECFDKTKDVRNILRSNKIMTYNAKVIGGCIKNNILHVTLKVDGQYTLALTGMGFTVRQAGLAQTLEPFFESVRDVFKKFPEINSYLIYYVDFEKITDKYGNLVENKKIIYMTLGMSRETANKVNWNYIQDNLKSAILYKEQDFDKIMGMLDIMKINNEYNH